VLWRGLGAALATLVFPRLDPENLSPLKQFKVLTVPAVNFYVSKWTFQPHENNWVTQD